MFVVSMGKESKQVRGNYPIWQAYSILELPHRQDNLRQFGKTKAPFELETGKNRVSKEKSRILCRAKAIPPESQTPNRQAPARQKQNRATQCKKGNVSRETCRKTVYLQVFARLNRICFYVGVHGVKDTKPQKGCVATFQR